MTRRFSQLPAPREMCPLALEWAMTRDCYLNRDLKEFLAARMNVTTAQRELRFSNGMFAFENYVDWVAAYFTDSNIHAGLDGKPHKSKTQPYRLTEYGHKLGRKIRDHEAVWPPWFQHR